MRPAKTALIIFILFASIFPQALLSQNHNPILITEHQTDINPLNYLYLYEDKDKDKKITEIIQNPGILKKNTHEYPAYGFTRSAIWGKLRIQNLSDQNKNLNLVFDFPLLDEIDIYLVSQNSIQKHIQTGNSFRQSEKKAGLYRQNIANFTIQKKDSLDLYFRILSTDTLEVPLLLLDQEQLSYYFYKNLFFLGIYYGIVLVMIFYNLFVYFSVRDTSYLYYVAFVFFVGMVQFGLDGFTFALLSGGNPVFSKALHDFFGSFAIITAMLFTASYLELKDKSRGLLIAFYIGAWITFLCFLYALFDYYNGIQLVLLNTFFLSVLFIISGLKFYRVSKPARFYFIAVLFSLLGGISISLKTVNIFIPFFTKYAMQVGQIIEVTLLSFALAYRIRILQTEKDRIQIQQIKLEKEHQENIHNMEILKIKNKNMEEDLDIAREIQMRLISQSIPERNLITMYHPMEKVGGDIIDIFPLSHDETGIFLGDVSGHGLPAALITIMIKSYLASRQAESRDDISNSLLYSPCDLLTGLNESLSSHLDTEFVSAFYGIFNKKTRTLIYKSAGHPPPFYIVKNSSGVTELKFMKMKPQLRLLGPIFNMLNDPKPENSEITFPPETRVVFYSDGLFDAVDYDYVKSEDGIPSFSTTFISEWFDDLYSITADEWAGKLSELLYLNRDRWVVDDDISAVFLDIE